LPRPRLRSRAASVHQTLDRGSVAPRPPETNRYNIWQTVPHAGPWSGWNRIGGWVSQIAATINSDGRLEAFGIGGDGALYNTWQTVPHAGPWSGWNRLGGWVSEIVPMRNSDGRLEVFGIGSDSALYNIWQTVAHAGPWSGWNKLA